MKITKYNWKLVSDVDAYIYNGNNVYLASASSKNPEILKEIRSFGYEKKSVEENKFKFKFDENGKFYIKSNSFQNPDSWYVLVNFLDDTVEQASGLISIISQTPNDKGEFGDTYFEAVFCNENENVFLINKGMSIYKKCFNEMRRILNCSLYKKTKKWIPGHRYDSEKGTLVYLGTFKSRKENPGSSEFISEPGNMKDVILCTSIPEDDTITSISDVFQKYRLLMGPTSGIQGSTIYEVPKIKPMVDGGEVLKPDMENGITPDLRLKMVENSFNRTYNTSDTGREEVKNISEVLAPLNYSEDLSDISDKEKELITKAVKIDMKNIMATYWKVYENKDEEEKSKSLSTSIISNYFLDCNVLRHVYYNELLKNIGLGSLIKDAVTEALDMTLNFDTFYKYSDIGIGFIKNYLLDYKGTKTPDNEIGDSDLVSVIKEISKNAMANNGKGVDIFREINIGTLRKPEIYYHIYLSINSLVNYYNGNVPGNIENAILETSLGGVTIEFYKIDDLDK